MGSGFNCHNKIFSSNYQLLIWESGLECGTPLKGGNTPLWEEGEGELEEQSMPDLFTLHFMKLLKLITSFGVQKVQYSKCKVLSY